MTSCYSSTAIGSGGAYGSVNDGTHSFVNDAVEINASGGCNSLTTPGSNRSNSSGPLLVPQPMNAPCNACPQGTSPQPLGTVVCPPGAGVELPQPVVY